MVGTGVNKPWQPLRIPFAITPIGHFVPVSPYCANEGRDVVVSLPQGGGVGPGE